MQLRSYAATHPGTRRSHNEDAFVDRPDLGLWAVADGAGGHQAGDFASGMIATALGGIAPGLNAADALAEIRARVSDVHAALLAEAGRRGPDVTIASTVVVLCVRGARFVCLWAGDSRAYRLADGVLEQISRDHSFVQELIDAGVLRPEDAEGHPRANVITRAVGAPQEDEFKLDKAIAELEPGERLLLCSDGISKCVPETEMAAVLTAGGPQMAQRLIEAALARQARDNVTAVVVEVLG